ncbi:sensor domain-containing protein [Cohnella abietis]|uniref:Putative sensor domain-containing protein n=1 Tax=Cohnella abietis TaxID=2507935 RepID=A0A3T1DAG6_9BACL|nr:sensor domain-containing protein [Cohnella abietis]BBI35059.1 hypothetical protein KCTCHS21_44580 [Cohnella abietis]
MKLKKALKAWKILIGSLPRRIIIFVIAIAGLCVGLSLAVFVVGLPLLAGTLIWCHRMLRIENRLISDYENREADSIQHQTLEEGMSLKAVAGDERLKSWRGWLEVLGDIQQYRNLAYGIIQLPIGILSFVFAILIPAVAIGLMLSPLAEVISSKFFSFHLFDKEWLMNVAFPNWSNLQRSWFTAGIGLALFVTVPFLLRKLGGYYASWIYWISGTHRITKSSEPVV